MLPIVILLFATTLFLGEDSPLNIRSVAGGAVVFVAIVSILSLMVPGTSDSCDLMFTPQNLSASGGYIGAFIASTLQNALGKPIAMVVLLGLVVVGLVIIAFRWAAFCAPHAIAPPILPSAVVSMSMRARGAMKRPCRFPASPVRT